MIDKTKGSGLLGKMYQMYNFRRGYFFPNSLEVASPQQLDHILAQKMKTWNSRHNEDILEILGGYIIERLDLKRPELQYTIQSSQRLDTCRNL